MVQLVSGWSVGSHASTSVALRSNSPASPGTSRRCCCGSPPGRTRSGRRPGSTGPSAATRTRASDADGNAASACRPSAVSRFRSTSRPTTLMRSRFGVPGITYAFGARATSWPPSYNDTSYSPGGIGPTMTSAEPGSSNVKPSDGSGPIQARSIGVNPLPFTLSLAAARRGFAIRCSSFDSVTFVTEVMCTGFGRNSSQVPYASGMSKTRKPRTSASTRLTRPNRRPRSSRTVTRRPPDRGSASRRARVTRGPGGVRGPRTDRPCSPTPR